jgi:hypothetical protein
MHPLRRAARAATLVALVGASTLISAGSVAAADPPGLYFLDVASCAVFDDAGNVLASPVVPAGSELVAEQGWLTSTHGQLKSFLINATWILTINDQSIDVRQDLFGPINLGPIWGVFFSHSAGTLGAGDAIHAHYDIVLRAASFDGTVHYPIGSVYGGGVDCTVTGA